MGASLTFLFVLINLGMHFMIREVENADQRNSDAEWNAERRIT